MFWPSEDEDAAGASASSSSRIYSEPNESNNFACPQLGLRNVLLEIGIKDSALQNSPEATFAESSDSRSLPIAQTRLAPTSVNVNSHL